MLTHSAYGSQASLIRLRIEPDPAAPRPQRRKPHPASTVDRIRVLVETTTLAFRDIAARTGASPATVSRHARRGGWLRPNTGFAEEHYSPEGRRALRRRALAETILRQAERILFETEMNPTARKRTLEQAMRLVRASRALDEEERPARRGRRMRQR
jgi:hypothetical protein